MKQINLSQTMISKSEQRFNDFGWQSRFTIGQNYLNTGMPIMGLFKSQRELILQDPSTGKYFLVNPDVEAPHPIPPTENKPKEKVKIDLVKIADLDYDDRIFKAMKTGDPIDYMFSTDGGIFPATNYMVIGDPGIGKSTQTLDILAKISKQDPSKKVLFISGEMNQIDMYGYVKRYPAFGQIPTLFLCDYIDHNTKEVLEETFNQGWDLILMDSFIEIQEAVQASNGMTKTHAEKWLIDLMIQCNKGNNEDNRFTSFLAIQQVTKGGNFVGSNKLKHNTTGMIELRFSSEFSGDRYAKVTKNRRGFKYERIYFSLDNPFSVEYDEQRLKRDQEIQERLTKEKDLLLNEEEKFNKIFGINTVEVE